MLWATLWGAAEYSHVADHAGFVLEDHEISQLRHAFWTFEQSYAWLCNHSPDEKLFRPRPKLHYMSHLTDQSCELRLNPQDVACWDDETYLHHCTKQAQACHGASVLKTSLLRYFIQLSERWHV